MKKIKKAKSYAVKADFGLAGQQPRRVLNGKVVIDKGVQPPYALVYTDK